MPRRSISSSTFSTSAIRRSKSRSISRWYKPKLTLDLLERRDIVFEKRLPVAQRAALPVGDSHRDTERIQQLQLRSTGRIQRGGHIGLERLEAAGGPDSRLTPLGAERQLRADEEDLWLEAEQHARVLGDKRSDFRNLGRALEDVALVHDHDNLLAPAADVLHEPAFGLRERTIGRGDKKYKIRTGDELGGHRLVLADDRVGSRRVDDADFAEQIDGRFDDEQVGLAHGLLGLVAMLQHGDDGRRRRDAFLHQRLADEGIDERALARVELADDDKQEQLVELRNRLVERLLLFDSGVDPRERGTQPHQQGPFFSQECILFVGKDARQHRVPGMHESDQAADYGCLFPSKGRDQA